MNTKDLTTEFEWPNHFISKNVNGASEEIPQWKLPEAAKFITVNVDKILFPDDTGIAFKNINEISGKLQAYDKVAKETNFL